MVGALTQQLMEWEGDPAITRVIVTAAGERAFSAGGDLRALFDFGRTRHYQAALAYWRTEYALNALIKRYRKPYVSLIDGIVMGGGVGISIHGSHRVAGDGFAFAMPEVGIGFIPDVGATWFLPRLPGELGLYCALTGDRLGPADALAAGIATHRVASRAVPRPVGGALRQRAGRRLARRLRGAGRGGASIGPTGADRSAVYRRQRGGHPGRARCAGNRPRDESRGGCRLCAPHGGRDPVQVSDQPQNHAGAAAARSRARFRRVHALRIPHSLAPAARA